MKLTFPKQAADRKSGRPVARYPKVSRGTGTPMPAPYHGGSSHRAFHYRYEDLMS